MEELRKKAINYAEENVINVLKEAFAKVYADGYGDGYKAREEEIPVNLRNNKTTYVDLGLPSGTMWSTAFENDGNSIIYLPYEKAVMYDLPTIDQWKELYNKCRWDFVKNQDGELYRADCVGPNGQVISFCVTGIINAIMKRKLCESFFWIKEDVEGNEKKAVNICRPTAMMGGKVVYVSEQISIVLQSNFSGYQLPIRQVRKK